MRKSDHMEVDMFNDTWTPSTRRHTVSELWFAILVFFWVAACLGVAYGIQVYIA